MVSPSSLARRRPQPIRMAMIAMVATFVFPPETFAADALRLH